MIALCEILLAIDVVRRGYLIAPYDVLPQQMPLPTGTLGWFTRQMATNVTAICWVGYLLVFDGLLTWFGRRQQRPALSSIRARPNRFIVAWLTSIPVWCFFDSVNFYSLDAWRYHGLPDVAAWRFAGYFIAFAAIAPGMFLAAQLYQHLGVQRVRWWGNDIGRRRVAWTLVVLPNLTIWVILLMLVAGSEWPAGTRAQTTLWTLVMIVPAVIMWWLKRYRLCATAFGAAFVLWAILIRDPIGSMTLWVGMIYLLDPLAARLHQPSLLLDWWAGRYGRLLALFAGGATCGLLWEFWNYWALAKWTYHLPFLGSAGTWYYFEMPLIGFLGFLPFAAECWVMLNVIVGLLERCRLRLAEPLPDNDAIM